MELIDLHTHNLPYVDDGAANLEEAMELLEMQAEQGVTGVCLTPHLRSGMFKSTDEKIRSEFARLQEQAEKANLPLTLWLSREYYFDADFCRRLNAGNLIPFGDSNVILVEFGYNTPAEELLEASNQVQNAGYLPLFAHVERYYAIQDDLSIASELMDMGTLMQMNAASILGKEGWGQRTVARNLLKRGCVHVFASDSHDTRYRPPNLGKCAKLLSRKIGEDLTKQLLYTNPLSILEAAEE